MTSRNIPQAYILLLTTIALLPTMMPVGSAIADDTGNKKPNIVLIVGDDMGYADVGIHGCKDIPTPHLDALAKSGVRFTNGYVTGPYCSPTRAGLLTGRYQNRFGHEFNPSGKDGLPLAETTLPQRLKSAGYATGIVGKWHLGSDDEFHPQRRGFDSFIGFLGGSHDYFNPSGIVRGNEPAGDKTYLTDAIARESEAFIDRHRAEPFFLYVSFNAVHTPMQAEDTRLKRFVDLKNPLRQTYAAMMLAMDDAVGRIMASLKKQDLTENTLIAFISDNGGPTMKGVTVNGSINEPLRGSKRTTLEGGIRVPFFVSWPSVIPSGTVDERPVIQLDLTATILAAARVQAQPDQKLEGVDLLPLLTSDKKSSTLPHERLFWRFGGQMALREGDWKLVRYDMAAEGEKGVSQAKLYNLKDDIGEANDLAAEHPDRVKAMQAAWDAWNSENIAPLWGGDQAKTRSRE